MFVDNPRLLNLEKNQILREKLQRMGKMANYKNQG